MIGGDLVTNEMGGGGIVQYSSTYVITVARESKTTFLCLLITRKRM